MRLNKLTKKKTKKIQIRNRYTDKVIYECKADAIKEAVEEADLSKVDLIYANLSNANLSNANLSNANLSNADLSNADLSYADLSEADLSKCYVWKTNFKYNKISKKTREQIIKLMEFKELRG